MSDLDDEPKRLLDEDDAGHDLHRRVLRGASAMAAPAAARTAIWSALEASLGPGQPPGAPPGNGGPGSPPAGPSGPPAPTGALGAAKAALTMKVGVLAFSALAVSAGVWTLTRSPASAKPPPSGAIIDPPPTEVAATRTDEGATVTTTPAPTDSAAPAVDAPARAKAPPPAHRSAPHPSLAAQERSPTARVDGKLAATEQAKSLLREESDALEHAQALLQGGDPAGALAAADQARAHFPKGVLGQEREVLSIEALSRLGRRDEASARAQAFVSAYPRSAHTARVRTFVRP